MKTSKVKNVQGNGTYESQHGTLFKFDYEFEDGTHLSANHKTQNHFKIGDTVEYTIKGSNESFSWGTVSKPKENNYNGYQGKKGGQGSTASFALAYAKDMAVAHIEKGNEFKADQVLTVATKFNDWLKANA
tara:strand:+ start:562 stop:954 length:393 start_codon:yes stop_codon:yes gene_type:complete